MSAATFFALGFVTFFGGSGFGWSLILEERRGSDPSVAAAAAAVLRGIVVVGYDVKRYKMFRWDLETIQTQRPNRGMWGKAKERAETNQGFVYHHVLRGAV